MSNQSIWLMVILVSGSVFLLRSSFFFLRGRVQLPRWFERALRFVPAAVLSALVFPALLLVDGAPSVVANPRLLAGLAAAVVAWRMRSLLWTIVVGMSTLLLLQNFI